MLLNALILLTAISFLWYGFNCLLNKNMIQEFKRFGLSKFHIPVGVLQLLGATGLLIGFLYPILILISSAGLALLMLLGVIVRIRIKDSLLYSIPAFILMLVNLSIFYTSYCSM